MKKTGVSHWFSKLSTKLIVIYVLLAIINISFFIIIVFQNQASLISENARFKAKELAENVYTPLNILTFERTGQPAPDNPDDYLLDEIKKLLRPIIDEYVIVNQKGKPIYKTSGLNFTTLESKTHIGRSILNLKAMGRIYLADFLVEDKEIIFYIPIRSDTLDNPILIFPVNLEEIDTKLVQLYKLGLLIIGIVLFTQILLGIILYQMIIRPVGKLNAGSVAIGQGNLKTRVDIKSNDEIGELGEAFNKMARTIEDQIDLLKEKNTKMLQELELAGNVQQAIYPDKGAYDRFNVEIFHKPLDIVSGDYHDICALPDKRYGFFITDVSGHGVSAALITMLIKESFDRYARRYDNPRDLLGTLNDNLSHLMKVYGSFFTAFYCILTNDNRLLYSCGGHYEMYLMEAESGNLNQLYTSGIMLGMTDESEKWLKQQEISVKKGDRIILYTDGIIDNKNSKGVPYEIIRFKKALTNAAHLPIDKMIVEVMADIEAYSKGIVSKDDQTLMIVEVTGDGSGN